MVIECYKEEDTQVYDCIGVWKIPTFLRRKIRGRPVFYIMVSVGALILVH